MELLICLSFCIESSLACEIIDIAGLCDESIGISLLTGIFVRINNLFAAYSTSDKRLYIGLHKLFLQQKIK